MKIKSKSVHKHSVQKIKIRGACPSRLNGHDIWPTAPSIYCSLRGLGEPGRFISFCSMWASSRSRELGDLWICWVGFFFVVSGMWSCRICLHLAPIQLHYQIPIIMCSACIYIWINWCLPSKTVDGKHMTGRLEGGCLQIKEAMWCSSDC